MAQSHTIAGDGFSCLISGEWVKPVGGLAVDVVNPATGLGFAQVIHATATEAEKAVAAARQAFATFSGTSIAERRAMIERLRDCYERSAKDLEALLVQEVGTTVRLVEGQSHLCRAHFATSLQMLDTFPFTEELADGVKVTREPFGVCAAITSWNNPISQILCKAVPAIAAGCTVIVKPSELAPLVGIRTAQIFAEADLPPGVFNLLTGGREVGEVLTTHPDVDLVSFTGSVPGGAAVAQAAAPTIKRVHQELGGKSPNIILPDADLDAAIPPSVGACFMNAGQVCAAPTRLIVPANLFDEIAARAVAVAEGMVVGDPSDPATDMGPLANAAQYRRVESYLASAEEEAVPLLTGGAGRPAGCDEGFFVKPTIFGPVPRDARIAREEIFGPVLVIHTYRTVEEAIEIANDTPFGLAAYVQGGDHAQTEHVAGRIRAGQVTINFPPMRSDVPFGGYKQSGNGRQFGRWGFEEFLETKTVIARV